MVSATAIAGAVLSSTLMICAQEAMAVLPHSSVAVTVNVLVKEKDPSQEEEVSASTCEEESSTSPPQASVALKRGIPNASVPVEASQFASANTVVSAGQVRLSTGATKSNTVMVWVQVAEAVFSHRSVPMAVHVRTMVMDPVQVDDTASEWVKLSDGLSSQASAAAAVGIPKVATVVSTAQLASTSSVISPGQSVSVTTGATVSMRLTACS